MKKPKKLPRDANQLAKRIVELSTAEVTPVPTEKPGTKKQVGGTKPPTVARRTNETDQLMEGGDSSS